MCCIQSFSGSRLEEAEKYLIQSVDYLTLCQPPTSNYLLLAHATLGTFFKVTGKFDKAVFHLKQVVMLIGGYLLFFLCKSARELPVPIHIPYMQKSGQFKFYFSTLVKSPIFPLFTTFSANANKFNTLFSEPCGYLKWVHICFETLIELLQSEDKTAEASSDINRLQVAVLYL